MAKKVNYTFNTKHQLWDDIEKYREFCADYGYRFDESTLNDQRSNVWRQYTKQQAGKNFRNCWEEDAKQFNNL
jgi:hypothetical protein